ncbi:MAG TPA: hypothetical protein VFV02_12690 [Acidimicrobiales bacterium]|nr:hypothetical protein [Acidimicrobiales bacterium]
MAVVGGAFVAVVGAAVPLDPPPTVRAGPEAGPAAGAVLVDPEPLGLVPDPVWVALVAPPLQAANTTAAAAKRARWVNRLPVIARFLL